jgi:hypothetical protein
MKVCEARIVHYCSFCPSTNKTETKVVCRICGEDVCPKHSYVVGTPTWGLSSGLSRNQHLQLPDSLGLRLHPICPACAGESVHAICRVLTERGGQS